jgi:hypothetical protein
MSDQPHLPLPEGWVRTFDIKRNQPYYVRSFRFFFQCVLNRIWHVNFKCTLPFQTYEHPHELELCSTRQHAGFSPVNALSPTIPAAAPPSNLAGVHALLPPLIGGPPLSSLDHKAPQNGPLPVPAAPMPVQPMLAPSQAVPAPAKCRGRAAKATAPSGAAVTKLAASGAALSGATCSHTNINIRHSALKLQQIVEFTITRDPYLCPAQDSNDKWIGVLSDLKAMGLCPRDNVDDIKKKAGAITKHHKVRFDSLYVGPRLANRSYSHPKRIHTSASPSSVRQPSLGAWALVLTS